MYMYLTGRIKITVIPQPSPVNGAERICLILKINVPYLRALLIVAFFPFCCAAFLLRLIFSCTEIPSEIQLDDEENE